MLEGKKEFGGRGGKKRPRNLGRGASSRLRACTLIETLPATADTLSFSWKNECWLWTSLFLTANARSPNFAAPPRVQKTRQVFLTGPEGPWWARRASQAVRGPTEGWGCQEYWGPSSGMRPGTKQLGPKARLRLSQRAPPPSEGPAPIRLVGTT